MLYHMRNRPILSLVLCVLSGLIDDFDGDLARYFGQTSKLGQLLDIGMDRLTNFAQMFILACIFPRYWLLFFSIAFVEFGKDFCGCMLNNHRFKVHLMAELQQSQDQDASFVTALKQELFQEMGLKNINLHAPSLPPAVTAQTTAFFSLDNALAMLHRYTWYTSDLFFWMIYLASFVSSSSSLSLLPPSSNADDLSKKAVANQYFSLPLHYEKSWDNFRLKTLRRFLADMCMLFDDSATLIEVSMRRFDFTRRVSSAVNFRIVFRVIGFVCLVGAFFKFYLNFQSLVLVFVDVKNLDMRVKSIRFEK
jgi:phosphatidylglycerophosphate synthase